MTKLQQESDRSRAASASLTHQLLQQSSGGNQSNTKSTVTAGIPVTITTPANSTNATTAAQQVDEDSKPSAIPAKPNNAITAVQQEVMDEDSKPNAMPGILAPQWKQC